MRNKIYAYMYIIFIAFIVSYFLNSSVDYFSGEDVSKQNDIIKMPFKALLIIAVIILPIIETLIFQHYIILFFRKIYVKKNQVILFPMLYSAIAFSLAHIYSIYYMIDTFIMGLYFAYAYIYILDKFKSKTHAFLVVLICHSLLNLHAVLTQ